MLKLWQTEWCPASRSVRQRLTELGVDYVLGQVPVAKEQRGALRETTGSDTIPPSSFRTVRPSLAKTPSASASNDTSPSRPRRRRTD